MFGDNDTAGSPWTTFLPQCLRLNTMNSRASDASSWQDRNIRAVSANFIELLQDCVIMRGNFPQYVSDIDAFEFFVVVVIDVLILIDTCASTEHKFERRKRTGDGGGSILSHSFSCFVVDQNKFL